MPDARHARRQVRHSTAASQPDFKAVGRIGRTFSRARRPSSTRLVEIDRQLDRMQIPAHRSLLPWTASFARRHARRLAPRWPKLCVALRPHRRRTVARIPGHGRHRRTSSNSLVCSSRRVFEHSSRAIFSSSLKEKNALCFDRRRSETGCRFLLWLVSSRLVCLDSLWPHAKRRRLRFVPFPS